MRMAVPHLARFASVVLGVVSSGCSGQGSGPDGGTDAPEAEPDAYEFPAERLYLNPDPPECLDRDQPPRWRAPDTGATPGTLHWVASLREERFLRWWMAAYGPGQDFPRMATSISGDGVVMWFSENPDANETWGLGLSLADGQFANSGQFETYYLPRIWLPRLDAFLMGHGWQGRGRYVPLPPFYSAESSSPPIVAAGIGREFWEGGPSVEGGEGGDMPAWSPHTGDIVTFGAEGRSGYRGVGAGCSEGTRWFTQLPIYRGLSRVFVDEDGDVIVGAAHGIVWILDGESGEILRTATFMDDRGLPTRAAVYQPGCGLLIETVRAVQWRWMDPETMELGAPLTMPEDRPTNVGVWSATADCGLVAAGGVDPLYLTRLEADGSVRYSVVFRETGTFGSVAGPPVALADGGTLLITTPPGWVRYDSSGTEIDRIALDTSVVGGSRVTEPVLAPDGTVFMMTANSVGEFLFFAAATGAVPGPFLWPDSGYNWARTNSLLPE